MDGFIEIFTLVTGLVYIILEIRQNDFMWIVGVLTSLAAVYMFMSRHLYASVALNLYYLAISFWGLYQWRKDRSRLAEVSDGTESVVHLNRLGWKTAAGCALSFALGLAMLHVLLERLGDPMSGLDAAAAVLSAVATYMLSRSYAEQWILWIAADLMTAAMCLSRDMYWMTALYAFYTASAVYGYVYWKRKGVYID